MPYCIKDFLNIQEYSSRRHVNVEILGDLILKPHTLKCRVVTCTDTKLACIKQASLCSVPLDFFKNNFLE
jgi:hypothetical protein